MSADRTPIAAPDGTLEPAAEGWMLRFERVYPHPPQEVWDALTRPERLVQWMYPGEVEVSIDLVEGGGYDVRSIAGDPWEVHMTVLRVDPPRLLEHTHVNPSAVMRWQLDPDGQGCRLLFTQSEPAREPVVENHFLSGMHHSLDRLADELAGAPTPWDWARWEELRDAYAALA
jgi:uncharacterized protein YndB with AHSA1/START domain